MSAAQWLAGLACAIAVLVAGDAASAEIRGRLDRLPFAVLRLARSRLPAGLRERIHDQEWVPELQHVLQHAELFPLTRLLTGLRFAAGLLIHARAVAAELRPDETPSGEGTGRTWRQHLAARSASVLHAVIWPVREPLPLRLYVAGVITAAAAATGAAAASATLHARDLELCAILLGCALIADGTPRAVRKPVHYDLRATWFLPAAILLPPLYALITPVPLFALHQLRSPSLHTYRCAFSAAASGLAYGAASALAHAAAAPAAGHIIPPGTTPIAWVLVIAACELLAAAGLNTAILIAIKGSAPTTRLLPLAANRTAAYCELTAIILGVTATFAAAASPLLTLTITPAVIVATRRIAATTPGPAPAS